MEKKYTQSQGNSAYGRKVIETTTAGNQYSRVQTQGPGQVKARQYQKVQTTTTAPKSSPANVTNASKITQSQGPVKYTKTVRPSNPVQSSTQLKNAPRTSSSNAYGNTVKNASQSIQKQLQKDSKGGRAQVNQSNNLKLKNRSQSQPQNGKYDTKVKTIQRGDNVMVTFVIYTTDPDPEFHIIEQLDEEFHERPSQYETLKKKAKKTNKESIKSTFSDSCTDWKPKEKGPSLCKSMVFQHAKGQHSSTELEGNTEPSTKVVPKKTTNNTKPVRTVTKTKK